MVFDDWTGSYIENKYTGERTPLVKKNGIYTFDLWTKGGGRREAEGDRKEEPGKEKSQMGKEEMITKLCEKVTEKAIASVREMLEDESAFGRLLESC